MRGEHRPEAAVAGGRRDQPERRSTQEDRVAAAVVGVGRHHDRVGRRVGGAARRATRPRSRASAGRRATMSAASTSSPRALDPDLERARQAAARIGVPDAALRPPRDRGLDGVGVVAEDDDRLVQAGPREPIEDVLEDRPALDRREQLVTTESRPGPGRQHDRDDPVGLAHATHARRSDGAGRLPVSCNACKNPAGRCIRCTSRRWAVPGSPDPCILCNIRPLDGPAALDPCGARKVTTRIEVSPRVRRRDLHFVQVRPAYACARLSPAVASRYRVHRPDDARPQIEPTGTREGPIDDRRDRSRAAQPTRSAEPTTGRRDRRRRCRA